MPSSFVIRDSDPIFWQATEPLAVNNLSLANDADLRRIRNLDFRGNVHFPKL